MRGGEEEEDRFLPTMIKGDLDSLKPHVRAYYQAKVSFHPYRRRPTAPR